MFLTDFNNKKVEDGELAICYVGQAGWFMKDAAGRSLILDPYLTDCGFAMRGFKRVSPMLFDPAKIAPTYYVASHIHFDHFDFEAIPVVAKESPDTKFFGPDSCIEEYKKLGIADERLTALNAGDVYIDGDLTIRAVYADHGTMVPDCIGVVLTMGGHTLYFAGDTSYHEEILKEVNAYSPEVGFFSVNGAFGNLTSEEGAKAARLTGVKYAVPCHFYTFMQHHGDPIVFMDALKDDEMVTPFAFRHGETVVLKSDGSIG